MIPDSDLGLLARSDLDFLARMVFAKPTWQDLTAAEKAEVSRLVTGTGTG